MTDLRVSEALRTLRGQLHRLAERSGAEEQTAERVRAHLDALQPDQLWTGLGGHGVAAAFHGAEDGPTVLIRADLDALPVADGGAAHLCGHDGHTTIVLGLAARLAAERPARGRAIVLFQPAEESGEGARAVVADPRFHELSPDHAFALHNLPGAPLGAVVVRPGTFCCASRGMRVELQGATSHAAHPEDGVSPAAAMCTLVEALGGLHEDPALADAGYTLATVVHARLGEVSFGTSPGEAVVMTTLRAEHDDAMARMVDGAVERVEAVASRAGLDYTIGWRDVFAACVNDADATARVRAAAGTLGLPVVERGGPFRWSEDFGALGATASSALFGLGAGEDHPQLHAPDYDFPDALLEPGAALFERIVRVLVGP